jgi:hypothetical protein
MRHVKFDAGRQEAFLACFAWSADTLAAAAEAGVSESTVYAHRRKDPAFAEAYRSALALGCARLEAEALRQRLAAQKALRAAAEKAPPGAAPPPTLDAAAEFERALKLLARRDRKERRPGGRQRWTFDAAIELLEKRMRGLGHKLPPPEEDSA